MLIRAMDAHRKQWESRWETLLRAEPSRSPLTDPEILVFKIEETCDEALRRLRHFKGGTTMGSREAACECGLNPLMAFFSTGEFAMTETLLRAIPTVPGLSIRDRREAVGDLLEVWAQLRSEKVAIFCSFCRRRTGKGSLSRENLKIQDARDTRLVIHR